MGMGFENESTKARIEWLGLPGTFDARHCRPGGRGSVIMGSWNCETGMMEKLMDRNGIASRISNVGWSLEKLCMMSSRLGVQWPGLYGLQVDCTPGNGLRITEHQFREYWISIFCPSLSLTMQ